jgi:two-component system cell cycle response regulator DivK
MSKHILVVEDQEDNRQILRDLLGAAGYEMIEAENGETAVTVAAAEIPDLILMDIQLPEISGLEVTKWLKEDDDLAHIPVIAVTAFAMKGDEERIREGGCEAYLSKPISVGLFLDTVRRFLG